MIDLGFDQSEADLSRPVIKPTTAEATCTYTKMAETKNGHPQLLIGWRFDTELEKVDGTKLSKFSITQRVITKPTGGLTQKMITDRLGQIHFALTGAKTGRPNTGEWIGKKARVVVKLREERTDENTGQTYAASNEVSSVYPLPKQG